MPIILPQEGDHDETISIPSYSWNLSQRPSLCYENRVYIKDPVLEQPNGSQIYQYKAIISRAWCPKTWKGNGQRNCNQMAWSLSISSFCSNTYQRTEQSIVSTASFKLIFSTIIPFDPVTTPLKKWDFKDCSIFIFFILTKLLTCSFLSISILLERRRSMEFVCMLLNWVTRHQEWKWWNVCGAYYSNKVPTFSINSHHGPWTTRKERLYHCECKNEILSCYHLLHKSSFPFYFVSQFFAFLNCFKVARICLVLCIMIICI